MNIDKLNINFLLLDSEVLEVEKEVIPLPPNREITSNPPNFLPFSSSAIVWLLREKVLESFLTFKDCFDYCVQIVLNTSFLFHSEKLLLYWNMQQKQKTSIDWAIKVFLFSRNCFLRKYFVDYPISHSISHHKFKTINLIYTNF